MFPAPHSPSTSAVFDLPFPHRDQSQFNGSSRGCVLEDDILVDKPIHFVKGQFAGKTVRAELHELQKAEVGRKYVPRSFHPFLLLHGSAGT
jgi:hypothetical protein